MANTYTQIYIQFVFAVKARLCLIQPTWEVQLYRYITGIVQNHQHKLIAVNGIADHLHILIGLHANQSVSDLMRTVKGESSEWINKAGFVKGKFSWQEGYGAFSFSRNELDHVFQYVMNQKEHHKRVKFQDEYIALLEESGAAFDERYILKSVV